jgi:exodeoxyribonuclease V alpha subunit
MECIEGTLSRIISHKPGKYNPGGVPYLIAKLTNGEIVKGECYKPILGERYQFAGEWRDQKGRDERAFCFFACEPLVDQSVSGTLHYLKTFVPTIGLVKAVAIVDSLGPEALLMLRMDPEVIRRVPKLTAENFEAVIKHFTNRLTIDPAAYSRLVDLFKEHKIGEKTIKRLLQDWGASAPDIITENPYKLLAYPRLGWQLVDAFALVTVKYEHDGTERHKAAIIEALERLSNQGHTYGSRLDIEQVAFGFLGARPSDAAFRALIRNEWIISEEWVARRAELLDSFGGVVPAAEMDERLKQAIGLLELPPSGRFAIPKLYEAERTIAGRLAALSAAAKPLSFTLTSERLNEDQRVAADNVRSHGVSALVGAPGTGKTFTITDIIKTVRSHGISKIKVVAPTGKAAKRASEMLAGAGITSSAVPCSTIHKALSPIPISGSVGASAATAKVNRARESFGFGHNAQNPIEVGFLVIDEASMVDVKLAASLLEAVPLGARVVFVGDANQLPSVGPGSFLRDIIDAGIPTAVLTKIQRSDSAGRVVHACHAIKDGGVPQPAERIELPVANWVHIEHADPDDIAQEIVGLHEASKRFPDLLWDFQVVSAQKTRLAFACANLNQMLSAKLNPPPEAEAGMPPHRPGGESPSFVLATAAGSPAEGTEASEEESGAAFRIGDKVVRTKNGLCDLMVEADPDKDHIDWRWDGKPWSMRETMVVNGDLGQVVDIVVDPVEEQTFVVVRFRIPDRLCRLAYGESHLIQAYAMTVHKMQGSGARYVIVPVHSAFYWDNKTYTGLWCRELIYTAISRTEELLVTVGQFSAIRSAIERKTIGQRRTRLVEMCREAFAKRKRLQYEFVEEDGEEEELGDEEEGSGNDSEDDESHDSEDDESHDSFEIDAEDLSDTDDETSDEASDFDSSDYMIPQPRED